MLDVHAPEHRVSGTRDFFVHIFTITVGLLIALGLENAVEAWHHHHLRREAEANIRQELQGNRETLLNNAAQVKAEREALLRLLSVMEERAAGGKLQELKGIQLAFHEQPIPDAAWRTASSTGVLNYMEYEEVERFADAYKQQEMLQTAEEQALDNYLAFTPILQIHGEAVTPEQAKDALPFVRQALAHVTGMLALGQGTLESYNDALK